MQVETHGYADDSDRLIVRPLAVLGKQKSAVHALDFSPDGTILVTRGWDDSCFWYEEEDGTWRFQRTSPGALLQIHSDQTFHLLFVRDGVLDRVEHQDRAGTCLQMISCSQVKQHYVNRYSPDQRWFLTNDHDGYLHFWDAETLHFETRIFLFPTDTHFSRAIDLLRFTPDGKQLFFRSGALICRCQFCSDPPMLHPEGDLFEHTPNRFSANDFAISPQGNLIAVANASELAAVELYENTSSSLRQRAAFPAGESPTVLDFSPDGKYLACADDECRIYIWNVETGQLEQTFVSHPGPYMEQASSVASLRWSPRGDILAVGGSLYEVNDFSIKLWKVTYGR